MTVFKSTQLIQTAECLLVCWWYSATYNGLVSAICVYNSVKHKKDFQHEAIKIALNSHLPQMCISSYPDVGKSKLSKWIVTYRPNKLI